MGVTDNGPARKSASGVTLQIVNADANLAHDQQQVDIASGAFEKIPAGFRSEVLWHSRVHDDPGSLWLRALIREAISLSADALRPRGSVNWTSTSASAAKAKKAKKVPARAGSRHANRV